MTTGRPAMATPTDRAFVSSTLHSFASHALERSSFRFSHEKGCTLEFAYELTHQLKCL